jgi:glycosyltransferase involved in cell wall biosynthesis
MLVAIDGNEANVNQRVGVHQYSYNLLWGLYNLSKSDEKDWKFIIYLKDYPQKGFPKEKDGWEYRVIKGDKFWVIKKLMPKLVENKKIDLFFTPSHYLPPLPLGLPKTCTIHDLGYLRYTAQFNKYDFWQLRIWTAISICISKCIIAVSEFTKKDIVRHYPFASKKVFVTHHGYDEGRFNNKISKNVVRQVAKKYKIPTSKNYILFLSTLKPSKNVEGLIDAYKLICKRYKDCILVISGKKGWQFDSIYEKVEKLKLERRVIFTGFIDEKYKPAVMKGAKVFVSPSFWEGFGMHVLEAMAVGTPVVVSNKASLPEVAGDAGIYVDPYDYKDIARGIKKVLKLNKNGYNRLVKRAIEQSKKFSWDKTAKSTLEVFERSLERQDKLHQ